MPIKSLLRSLNLLMNRQEGWNKMRVRDLEFVPEAEDASLAHYTSSPCLLPLLLAWTLPILLKGIGCASGLSRLCVC
jgi:hypothetical protein